MSPDPAAPPAGSGADPYRGVVFVLLAAAVLGAAAVLVAGLVLADIVLVDAALYLGLAASVLLGVAAVQAARAKGGSAAAEGAAPKDVPILFSIQDWLFNPDGMQEAGYFAARLGGIACAILLFSQFPAVAPTARTAALAAALCLFGAGLCAVAAGYLGGVASVGFPEGAGLCRGARVAAWVLALAAASAGLSWAGEGGAAGVLHFIVLAIDAAVCYGLFAAKPEDAKSTDPFSLDLDVLEVLGGRPNVLAGVLDAAERQLGIDLRSTWALTVVRRGLEPLLMGLCLLGWLSTSLTVIGVQEQGLVERLGVPVSGPALLPGLHAHWPWPIDRVYRIPTQLVQSFDVGHSGGDGGGGPENVLWAVEHDPNEYALLLGDGRDLVSMDASVQYRIVDPRAWRYHCSNPADALSAVAYRAVMRSTADRSLSDVLSENRAQFTGDLRDMVQKDADAMGLGVQITGFLVGAMHPPVPVAREYEAVVSAEIGKVTSTVDAQTYRNQLVPAAEAEVVASTDTARAESDEERGRAAGEAWAFRTLEAQFHAAPREYFFRRRLETLEKGLAGRGFIVIDSRIERDGGQLWLTQ